MWRKLFVAVPVAALAIGGSTACASKGFVRTEVGNVNSKVDTLSGTVKPGRSTAPYLGVGYGNVSGTGVNFYTDFGIIFQGSPKASLSCSGLSAGACATLVASEQTRVEDELKRFKYYPVLNIGLTVGF